MTASFPSLQLLNRTFIGSVLFLDIVDYSRQTVPDQQAMKEVFIDLLIDALKHVAVGERIMVDTGDGAGIAFLGDPEDALFTALSLRDAIEAGKAPALGMPGFVRMGINLGPLKVVRDVNGHTNMIGDGVNDAQRVMSFAVPGQVMVSRSYYDIVSRFSHDYAKLFAYEGTKHDKHVREHEVYSLGSAEESENMTEKMRDRSRARQESAPHATKPADSAPSVPSAAARQPAHGKRISRNVLFGLSAAVGCILAAAAAGYWANARIEQVPAPVAAALAPALAPSALAAASASAAKDAAAVPPAAAVPDPLVAQKPLAAAPPGKVDEAPKAELAQTASATATVKPEREAGGSAPKSAGKMDTRSVERPEKDSTAVAVAPVKSGTLTLAIKPWGEVFVDGSKRGITPPLKSMNLPPGKHQVLVRNGSFMPYKQTVEVQSGATANVSYAF